MNKSKKSVEQGENLYRLFQESPHLLASLIGAPDKTFTTQAETFEDSNRETDLCWFTEGRGSIMKIQVHDDSLIYYRGEALRTLLSMRYPSLEVSLYVLFLYRSLNPHKQPWKHYLKSENPHYHALFLGEQLEILAKTKPDHPLHSMFAPVVARKAELKQQAKRHHYALTNAALPRATRRIMIDLYESFLMTRFQAKSKKKLFRKLSL